MDKDTTNIDSRYKRWRIMIFGITWLAYVGFYFTRKAFPVAKVGILEDPTIGIGKASMGVVDGVFGVAYCLGQFIWGMCGDRFGPRIVVLSGMFVSILAALAMGMSSTIVMFGILMFLQGFCQATGWAPLTKNVSYWFSRPERGRVYGFWSTNYAIGGMLASAFAGYMALLYSDWRYAFFMSAAVLGIIWLLFFLLQRNRPSDIGLPDIEDHRGEHEDGNEPEHAADKSEVATEGSWAVIREVFRNPMILRLGAIYFLLKPARYAILFWGPVIVYERLDSNIGESALISAVFEAAGPLGVIFAGYASDKWFQARRIPVIVINLLILSLILFSFSTVTQGGGTVSMVIILAAIGFFLFGPDALISSTAAVDFGTQKGAGSAAGFINGMGSTGQILGLSLPGLISELYGWNTLFMAMGCFVALAGLILLPKWNAVPQSRAEKAKS
jgi:OPA family sugar phosphate sensor protein UhpC-like MFS transporter